MKKFANNLILTLSLCAFMFGAMSIMSSCSKDSTSSDLDPNEFCNGGECAVNNNKKNACIASYNECIDNTPNANHDECKIAALLICG